MPRGKDSRNQMDTCRKRDDGAIGKEQCDDTNYVAHSEPYGLAVNDHSRDPKKQKETNYRNYATERNTTNKKKTPANR